MFVLSLISLLLLISANSCLQNKKVETYIDVSSQLVNVMNKITIQNDHPSPKQSYIFIVDPQWSYNVAFITAEDENKQPLNTTRIMNEEVQHKYEIHFRNPVIPNETVNIYIKSVVSNYLQSYPKTVKQGDKHLVLFSFNVYYYSLYFTQEESTVVHLGKTRIISIDSVIKSSSDSFNEDIKYGSFTNTEPMSKLQSVIHFENPSTFLTVEKLKRIIQISQWGYIKIREDVTIIHAGPTFKGSFERGKILPPDTRIESFTSALPSDALDIQLQDEIGLLWSFDVDKSDSNKTLVNIRPRFIMYGGWKTQYHISYTLPIRNYVHSGPDSTFSLSIPKVDKIFPQMVIKEAIISIVLPEGATYRYSTPHTDLVNNTGKKFCYFLDVICREIISLEKQNLVDEHATPIQLTYFFPQMLLLIKPLTSAGFLYFLFVLFIIFTHIKQSNTQETKINKKFEEIETESSIVQAIIKKSSYQSKQKIIMKQRNKKM